MWHQKKNFIRDHKNSANYRHPSAVSCRTIHGSVSSRGLFASMGHWVTANQSCTESSPPDWSVHLRVTTLPSTVHEGSPTNMLPVTKLWQ